MYTLCLKAVLVTARPPKILINYCQLTILLSLWLWTHFKCDKHGSLHTHTHASILLVQIYHSVFVFLWNSNEFKQPLTETDGAIQYCIDQHWYAEVWHKVKCQFSIKSSDLIIPFSTLCALQRNKKETAEWNLMPRISKSSSLLSLCVCITFGEIISQALYSNAVCQFGSLYDQFNQRLIFLLLIVSFKYFLRHELVKLSSYSQEEKKSTFWSHQTSHNPSGGHTGWIQLHLHLNCGTEWRKEKVEVFITFLFVCVCHILTGSWTVH